MHRIEGNAPGINTRKKQSSQCSTLSRCSQNHINTRDENQKILGF